MNSFDIMTKFLYDCKVEYLYDTFKCSKYPWDILPLIKPLAQKLINDGIDGFEYYSDGVLVGKNVKIDKTATIIPPTVIGEGCEIRPGAYIRGNVITGKNCVIGNSTELKNCILLDGVQVPHYNYVGDSVLGNKVHLGAGSICSNLKADDREVVIHAQVDIKTGMRKVGALLSDGVDVGCGCVLNPGTVIGKNTSVYPLTSVRGVIPSDCIVKSQKDIVIKKEVL